MPRPVTVRESELAWRRVGIVARVDGVLVPDSAVPSMDVQLATAAVVEDLTRAADRVSLPFVVRAGAGAPGFVTSHPPPL
jgi:hypothetical protein